MMIMAIFAMSLDLLQDVTGLVSLWHAAYFGLTGYALAFLTPQGEAVNLWWTLPVAVLASATAALIIGFFVARTHGIYFIMVAAATRRPTSFCPSASRKTCAWQRSHVNRMRFGG